MRETGQILKKVRVADCADGPHEVRGCVRNDLVRTLSDALPPGTVRLGCSVASADFSPEGMPYSSLSCLFSVVCVGHTIRVSTLSSCREVGQSDQKIAEHNACLLNGAYSKLVRVPYAQLN